MNKILSWKINSGTYAYIFIPNSTSYISNRIPEDSPLWQNIIGEISRWDYSTYKTNFDKMAMEVAQKYGQTIPWRDEYWDFTDTNSVGNVNIVLLSGKDGVDGSVGNINNPSDEGTDTDGDGDYDIYDEVKDVVDNELRKAKEDILKQNEEVKKFIDAKVTSTISEAKNTIAETKKELADVRSELEDKLENASDALDKAAALFELGEGGITPEKLQEVMTSVGEYGNWITSYSGLVCDIQTDYEIATGRLGSMGTVSAATDGLFSRFATSLNVYNNTVGNVESWMVASAATIGDMATWYNDNAEEATKASRIINAMESQIVDTIEFISGDGFTTKVSTILDGKVGVIKDEILSETSNATTRLTNEMNALSGYVSTHITRLDEVDGRLTSMGNDMEAVSGTMETWITVSMETEKVAYDLREHWSVESGKLSTVANLTAETDDKGNIIYNVSATTGEEYRVFKNNENQWVDSVGNIYEEKRVYVNFSTAIASYIQQRASSVTISVMNEENLTAAIKVAIEKDSEGNNGSIIKLVADKIVISGDMIAGAISANTADIGGIIIGNGRIESSAKTSGSPNFVLNGKEGSLYAINATVSGSVYATNGHFSGKITASSGTIGGIKIDNSSICSTNGNFSLYSNGSGQLGKNLISWGTDGSMTVDGAILNPIYNATKDTNHLNRTVYVTHGLSSGINIQAGSFSSSNVSSSIPIKRLGTIMLISNSTEPSYINLSNKLEICCVTAKANYTVTSQTKSFSTFILLPGSTMVFDVLDVYNGSKRILKSATPTGWFWDNGTVVPSSYNNASYSDLSGFSVVNEALGTKTSMSGYESVKILTIPPNVVEYMSIKLLAQAPSYISKNYDSNILFSFINSDNSFGAAAPAASTIKSTEKFLNPTQTLHSNFKAGGNYGICNSLTSTNTIEPGIQTFIVKLYDKKSMIGYANVFLFKVEVLNKDNNLIYFSHFYMNSKNLS